MDFVGPDGRRGVQARYVTGRFEYEYVRKTIDDTTERMSRRGFDFDNMAETRGITRDFQDETTITLEYKPRYTVNDDGTASVTLRFDYSSMLDEADAAIEKLTRFHSDSMARLGYMLREVKRDDCRCGVMTLVYERAITYDVGDVKMMIVNDYRGFTRERLGGNAGASGDDDTATDR